MNEHLSMERLGLLLRADLVLRARTVLTVAGTLAALIVVHGVFTVAYMDPSTDIFPAWFFGMLFVWGPVAASYSFLELHDKSRNQAYLLLPASALEKTLSRLLIVTVLFVPFVFVFVTVASWLNGGINLVLFGEGPPLFRPGDYLRAGTLGQVLVAQSIFFLGAAWFRRSHLVKTTFAVTLIGIAFSLIASLILWVVYRDVLPAFGAGGMSEPAIYNSNQLLFDVTGRLAPILYYFVLPPFCWWVAWLRVKETQVSYGV